MSTEKVTVYPLDGDSPFPMDRREFYEEQVEEYKTKGKPSKAVEVANIFLFNSDGDLIVQKRSESKAHNAGLLDKSTGGHVTFGDSPDYTVMVETIQELQVPSITVRTQEEFLKTFKLLNNYLNTVAIVKQVGTEIKPMEKIIKGEKILIANKIDLYFGVFNGAVKMVDKEAKGIMFYSLEELKDGLEKSPDMFTYDLKYLVGAHEQEIRELLDSISPMLRNHQK